MDGAWRRPPNHWRITGTPSLSEVPSGGARAFCLLLRFSKVSRRQGGTLGGRYRRNGYVLGITVSPVRPPSRASPLPQLDCGVSGIGVGWEAAIAGKPAPHWSCIAHKISARHRSLWSGLAREAACQSLNIQLNHRYRWQASSHWSCIAHKIRARHRSLWERACPRRRRVSH